MIFLVCSLHCLASSAPPNATRSTPLARCTKHAARSSHEARGIWYNTAMKVFALLIASFVLALFASAFESSNIVGFVPQTVAPMGWTELDVSCLAAPIGRDLALVDLLPSAREGDKIQIFLSKPDAAVAVNFVAVVRKDTDGLHWYESDRFDKNGALADDIVIPRNGSPVYYYSADSDGAVVVTVGEVRLPPKETK